METTVKQYNLIIGKIEKDWNDNIEKYMGHTESVRLPIPSVEVAHQIASLCNIKIYIITEGEWHNGKQLFVSQEIIDWHNKQNSNRQKYDALQTEITQKLNALPREYIIKEYDTKEVRGKVIATLNEAEYRPSYLRSIQGGSFSMSLTGKYSWEFYPENYKTKSGVFSPTRFIKKFWMPREDKGLIDQASKDLKEIDSKFEEIAKSVKDLKDDKRLWDLR